MSWEDSIREKYGDESDAMLNDINSSHKQIIDNSITSQLADLKAGLNNITKIKSEPIPPQPAQVDKKVNTSEELSNQVTMDNMRKQIEELQKINETNLRNTNKRKVTDELNVMLKGYQGADYVARAHVAEGNAYVEEGKSYWKMGDTIMNLSDAGEHITKGLEKLGIQNSGSGVTGGVPKPKTQNDNEVSQSSSDIPDVNRLRKSREAKTNNRGW